MKQCLIITAYKSVEMLKLLIIILGIGTSREEIIQVLFI